MYLFNFFPLSMKKIQKRKFCSIFKLASEISLNKKNKIIEMTLYHTIIGYSIIDSFHRVYFRNNPQDLKEGKRTPKKSYKQLLKAKQTENYKRGYELRRKFMKEMMNIKPITVKYSYIGNEQKI